MLFGVKVGLQGSGGSAFEVAEAFAVIRALCLKAKFCAQRLRL